MAVGGALREGRRLGFLLPPALVATAGGLVAGTLAGLGEPPSPDRLPHLTVVQGISVGGLEEREARRLLAERLSPLLDLKVVLLVSGRRFFTTWRQLGARLDVEGALREARGRGEREAGGMPLPGAAVIRPVPVRAEFDEGALLQFLRGLARRANVKPADATLIWLGGGRKRIVPEREGLALKVEEAARLIEKIGRWPRTASIALPVERIRPKVTAEILEPIDSVLGAFTTYFDPGNRNRAHNIRLVAKRLMGKVVLPGEVFSFNKAVGPRTRSRGYLPAPIFVNGEVVTGIGGGACQVSTTLYNAAKRAGMRIVERHLHSLPVYYVPSGYDATVVYGALDLKFKNVHPFPVVIWTEVEGGRLTVLILGPRRGGGSEGV